MARVSIESLLLYLSLTMLVTAVALALIQRYVASTMSLIVGMALLNYLRGRSHSERDERSR